jgi:hypothetical protein
VAPPPRRWRPRPTAPLERRLFRRRRRGRSRRAAPQGVLVDRIEQHSRGAFDYVSRRRRRRRPSPRARASRHRHARGV